VPSGAFHRVHTVSDGPSCFLYEYQNRTDAEMSRYTRSLLEAWQARESDVPAGSPRDSEWLAAEIAAILNNATPPPPATDTDSVHQRGEGAAGGRAGGAAGGRGGQGGGDWRSDALLRSLLKTAFAVRNVAFGRPSSAQLQWEAELVDMTSSEAQHPSRSEL
ncbi:unnamed protein product, partial [Lampetra fluviatilis]